MDSVNQSRHMWGFHLLPDDTDHDREPSESFALLSEARAQLEGKLAKLREPFRADQIGYRPVKRDSNVQVAYVGHAVITDRILDVDPFYQWEFPHHTDAGGRDIGVLTICGISHWGSPDTGETDWKKAESDAFRRAAMRFGVGLALWARQELESAANERRDAMRDIAGQISDIQVADLAALAEANGWNERRIERACHHVSANAAKSLADLTPDEAATLTEYIRQHSSACATATDTDKN